MIKLLKQYYLLIGLIALVSILYFVLRIPNLTTQPIFADEAIYIRWAQVMKSEPTLRFLPLSDGKTPLFMWAMIPLFKVFQDPLFAGRLLSIMSGFLTLLGGLFLGWKFFNLRVGILSALFIAITPFMVFFDRMALVDTLLAAFSIWSLNLSLLLMRYQRIDLAMCLGYILGGGLLTKTPGMFSLLTVPVTILLFNFQKLDRDKRLLKIFGLWMIAFGITLVIYNVLRLGHGFTNITSRNQDYMFSFWELRGRVLDPFIPHFHDISDWLPKLLTIPTLAIIILAIGKTLIKRNKIALVILLWSITPLVIQMFLLKTFTARYILFSIPPLLVLGGWVLNDFLNIKFINKYVIGGLILAVLMGNSLYFNYLIVVSIDQFNLPRSERSGYLEEWTAGYGFKEIVQFLDTESKKQPIVVGTEGSFGTLPDGLQIYLDKNRKVAIVPGKATISAELIQATKTHPTYFVANKSRFLGSSYAELLKSYPKAISPKGTQDAILFFKLKNLSE